MLFRPLLPAIAALVLLSHVSVRAQTAAPSSAGAVPPGTAPAAPAGSAALAPRTGGTNAAASGTLTSPAEAAKRMIVVAAQKMNANDLDGALNALTQAINLNPNSTGAYVLRASIYCQRHQFKPAEDDFNAAARLAPTNPVLKLNLVEIKFMQKEYDLARPGFASLTKDPDMGDFAKYKVFLCDLLGGHEDQAKKELDVFNDVMGNASYYFANASWDLVHKDTEGARSWLLSASHIYPAQKFTMYGQSLRDLGYLPIPEPKDGSDQP